MRVDEKIEMYTEENATIESQIEATVSNYMKYEGDTFADIKEENAMSLVSLYPELKSDELVKAQIETYQKNNEKLKELKEELIDRKTYRWLIYFGE